MEKTKLQALEELDAYCVKDLPDVRRRMRDACNIALKNLNHTEIIEYDDEKDVFQANLEPSRKRRRCEAAYLFRETPNQQNPRIDSPFREQSIPRSPTINSTLQEPSIPRSPTINSTLQEPSIQRSPTINIPFRETPIQSEETLIRSTRRARARSTHSTARERPSQTAAGSRSRQTAAGERSVHELRRNPKRPGRPEPDQFIFGYVIQSSRFVRRGGGRRGGGRRGGARRGGARRVRARRVRGRRREEEGYVSDDVIEQEVIIELENDSDIEKEDDDTDIGTRDTGFKEEEDATDFRETHTGFEEEEVATDFREQDIGFEDEEDVNVIPVRYTVEDEDDDATEFEEDGTKMTKADLEKSADDMEHVRLGVENLNVNIDYNTSNCLSIFQKTGGFCLLLFDTLRAFPEATCKLIVTKESMEKGLLKAFGIKLDDDFDIFMTAVAIDLKLLIRDFRVDVSADVSADEAAIGLSWSEADVEVVPGYFSNRRSELLSQRDLLFDTGLLVSSLREINTMQTQVSNMPLRKESEEESRQKSASEKIPHEEPPSEQQGWRDCELSLPGNPNKMVASGLMYMESKEEFITVHGTSLLDGYKKVEVKKVHSGSENALLPVPVGDELIVLIEAKDSYVQWPHNHIHSPSKMEIVMKKKKKNQRFSPTVVPTFLDVEVSSEFKQKLRTPLMNSLVLEARVLKASGALINVPIDDHVLHLDKYTSLISYEDLIHWCDEGKISAAHIAIFMRYLSDLSDTMKSTSLYGFLFPEPLSKFAAVSEDYRSEYIAKAMTCTECGRGRKLIFAAYHESDHWMLAAISPSESTVHWCDPAGCKPRQFFVEIVTRAFEKRNSIDPLAGFEAKPLAWKLIKCPMQPLGSVLCGYYVCRYMLELVTGRHINITPNFMLNAPKTYTVEQIDEVRNIWAEFTLNFKPKSNGG